MLEIDPMDLYNLRTIVMTENDEGNFQQVLLTKAQFKKMSDAIFTRASPEVEKECDLRPGFEAGYVELGEREIPGDFFNGMADIEIFK